MNKWKYHPVFVPVSCVWINIQFIYAFGTLKFPKFLKTFAEGLRKLSDSSEKLLQRGRVVVLYVCGFGEGGIHVIKHMFIQKVSSSLGMISAGHEEQSSPWRTTVLF